MKKNTVHQYRNQHSVIELNSKGDTHKKHDLCHNPKCKCHKLFTFTPKQFQPEGAGFEKKKWKLFKSSQKAWNSFPKPAVNTLATVIGVAVIARSKNPQVGQTMANILKTISGGKVLSLTEMHENG